MVASGFEKRRMHQQVSCVVSDKMNRVASAAATSRDGWPEMRSHLIQHGQEPRNSVSKIMTTRLAAGTYHGDATRPSRVAAPLFTATTFYICARISTRG